MNKRYLLILIACYLLGGGCRTYVSPYTLAYVDESGGLDFNASPYFEKFDGFPAVLEISSQNVTKAETELMYDGYVRIGYSTFNAQAEHEYGVTKQAKKVHASKAIWYSQHTHTDTKTIRSIYSSEPKYDSSGVIVGFNNKYRNETYDYRYFDHGASYWVKIKDSVIRLGVAVKDLTVNKQQGMEIVGVLKNSPASQVGLLRGDILRKIGKVQIYNRGALLRALKKYAGSITPVVFLRSGEEYTRDVKLNRGMTIKEPFSSIIHIR